jgi:hypothetical protein
MRRAAAILLLGTVASALTWSSAGAERRHRIKLPEAELPRSLTVDESEWALRPSKRLVAAGPVRIRVYNRGEDDHNLVVHERDGTPHVVSLKPKESGTITARLAPGTYTLVCSLFAGTPDSHEALGMTTTIRAR